MLQKEQESIVTTVTNVFTLGLFSPNLTESDKGDYTFEKHQNTCEYILADIKQLIDVLINSWILSDDLKNLY